MELQKGIGVVICLVTASVVYAQTQLPTTVNPRDVLFAKPRTYERFKAPKNKTRFTMEEKLLILQIHNSYRSLVDPPAVNMLELIWDDDLEEYAWQHTQKCTGAHSAGTMIKTWNATYTQTWKYMGENLYYSYAPGYNIEEALWMFWEEGSKYDIITPTCTHRQTCGHYRVMVTAKSSRIGCAMKTCSNFTVSKYPTPAVFLSCSYNGQNLVYYKPYVVGERCSNCTTQNLKYDYQICRHGLCITPEMKRHKKGFNGDTSCVGIDSSDRAATTTAAPRDTTTDPRGTTTDSRGTTTDPRGTTTDSRGTTTDPRGTNSRATSISVWLNQLLLLPMAGILALPH